MSFTVTDIIDGDTFAVEPDWKWRKETGDRVRPVGYDAPEEGEGGYKKAKEKLRNLIMNKEVELTDPVRIDRGRLVCTVLVDGVDLADHFLEYQ